VVVLVVVAVVVVVVAGGGGGGGYDDSLCWVCFFFPCRGAPKASQNQQKHRFSGKIKKRKTQRQTLCTKTIESNM
jgi:hypothetical protein